MTCRLCNTPNVLPCLPHAHRQTKFSTQIPHDQMHKKVWGVLYCHSNRKSAILMCGNIFSQIHAYFENYVVLELKHHSLQINSIIIFMP